MVGMTRVHSDPEGVSQSDARSGHEKSAAAAHLQATQQQAASERVVEEYFQLLQKKLHSWLRDQSWLAEPQLGESPDVEISD